MAHMKRYGHQFNEHISNVMTLFKMGVPVPFEVSWSDLDLDHVHQRSCFYGNLFWEIIVLSQNFWPISHKWSVMYMVGNLWISAFLQNLKETIFLILWSGQNCALILAVCQIYNTITDGGSTAPLYCWYHTEEKTIQEHKRDWIDVRRIVRRR